MNFGIGLVVEFVKQILPTLKIRNIYIYIVINSGKGGKERKHLSML